LAPASPFEHGQETGECHVIDNDTAFLTIISSEREFQIIRARDYDKLVRTK